MSIVSELEKLVSLRDRGDLCQADFEKAKQRLLSEEVTSTSPAEDINPPRLPEKATGGKLDYTLPNAIIFTITSSVWVVSLAIKPSLLGWWCFALFSITAILSWIVFFQSRARK